MNRGTISREWRAWVVENLARGADPRQVIAELGDAGVPDAVARAFVSRVESEEALGHARSLARRVAALEEMVRLRPAHRVLLPDRGTRIERIPRPSVEVFQREYWAPGAPVIFTDLVPSWPAFGRWGLDDLDTRLPAATISACRGRNAADHPDVDWRALERTMSVAELVQSLRTGDPNDVYVTTNNAALGRSDLRPLLDDIALPTDYFGDKDPKFMGLWIGMHTHTPTHHDHANGILCQVVGRKRVVMVPPDSLEMLESARGVYNRRDTDAELKGIEGTLDITLEEGEALFIPTGWWHRVDANGFSMSVSIRKFAWPNVFNWYRPGTALAGRS